MHILAAFYESFANGSVYQEVNGVLDQALVTDASNRVQAPWDATILAAYVGIPNITAARVRAPSLLNLALPEIYPASTTAAPPSPTPVMIAKERGPRLKGGEYFIVEASRGGAAVGDSFAGLWIAPQLVPAVNGPTTTIVATATPTLVLGAWALGALTFSQTLPVGRYQIVGMNVVCASSVFARLVFPGGTSFRPGVVTNVSYGNLILGDPFRYGRLGSYGEFEFNVPPAVEIMGTAAGAQTATVMLDVVKVR